MLLTTPAACGETQDPPARASFFDPRFTELSAEKCEVVLEQIVSLNLPFAARFFCSVVPLLRPRKYPH